MFCCIFVIGNTVDREGHVVSLLQARALERLNGQPSDRNEQNNKPKQKNNEKKENKKKVQD